MSVVAHENTRIEELRSRLQKDPASIAFAQLAEEYRRASRFREAIDTCRSGLVQHPGYLSARVTLGRSLLEIGELEEARRELTSVLRAAPENLAAIRGLAELHRRRGEIPEALERYRSAFELARNDPGIDQIVRDLKRELEPRPAAGEGSRPVAPARGEPLQPPPAPRPTPPRGVPPSQSTVQAEGADQGRPRRTMAYLQRWLEAILADRRSRLYGAHA